MRELGRGLIEVLVGTRALLASGPDEQVLGTLGPFMERSIDIAHFCLLFRARYSLKELG